MDCIKCKRQIPGDSVFCMYCGKDQRDTRKRTRRGNNTGTIYKRPDGKWQVTVTVGWFMKNGKRCRRTKSATFTKRTDAVNAAPLLIGTPPSSKETVKELHDIYLESKDYAALSDSQKYKLKLAYSRWEPYELRPLASLTVDDLQTLVEKTTDTYYPARDMKVIMSHIYKIAVRREIVQRNKAEDIELPDAPSAKRLCWESEHIAAMWEDYESGNLFTGYLLIMCYCGLRFGELYGLQLENIHLDERYMIGGEKTEAGIDRIIPISSTVFPIVKRFYEHRKKRLCEMNRDNWYDAYHEATARMGIPDYPPQTCRHWYFTTLTAKGIQPGIIAETGGHSSYLTTMKNYVRIPLSDKLAAADSLTKPD